MAERMIDAGGVKLCTEAFGDPADPPVLLVMGMSGSMLWWDEAFCQMLADRGRFVIRYDHRDTGRSVTYEPGRPGYTVHDLVTDVVAVLDGYGIEAAQLVGVSMGGALAQLATLDFPERVRSLVLISTSPAVPIARELPGPTERFRQCKATVDWSSASSVVEYLVEYSRMLSGGERAFDEAWLRNLAEREVQRARNFAAAQNHGLIDYDDRPRPPLSAIAVPTLVIHGSSDPMFPLEHGRALAKEIRGARLLTLEGAGHGVDPADWDTIADAVVALPFS